eukprot:1161836-Rhodomonas_salina.3
MSASASKTTSPTDSKQANRAQTYRTTCRRVQTTHRSAASRAGDSRRASRWPSSPGQTGRPRDPPPLVLGFARTRR